MSYKLSIIIPVYNVERYIKRCLDSIFNQNVDEKLFEVIIVNDGTLDNSVEIINTYLDIHKNIVLINQKNQGLSVARNNGFEKATGDYVWFVDSDDWLFEGGLLHIMSIISSEKYSVIASNLMYVYDDISRNYVERFLNKDLIIDSADYILHYCVGASPRFVIKRQLMIDNKLKFYPGILHEDGEFNLRLICCAHEILLIKEVVYAYYQRGGGSIMSTWTIKNTECALVVYKNNIELAEKISVKKLHDSVLYEALNVLLFAFPYTKYKSDSAISRVYREYLHTIRMLCIRLLFSSIPFKKKIFVSMVAISPMFSNIIRKYVTYRSKNINRAIFQ